MEAKDDSTQPSIQPRASLKTQQPLFHNYDVWKRKLRENCFQRVREDRKRLLWKMRALPNSQHLNFDSNKGLIKSAFEDIVSDEINKLMDLSSNGNLKISNSVSEIDDVLWEYDGLPDAYVGDCEEMLLEMQRIFYEDLKTESTTKELENYVETWEDEEDEHLARSVYEHMQLNEKQDVIWCPVCKRGELQESDHLIHCTVCNLRLKKGDEVNLALLKVRLAEVHAEHLDRGCALMPKFCIETRFDITALYIICIDCSTFEVVI